MFLVIKLVPQKVNELETDNNKQQKVTEKSAKLGHRKGSGIAGNPEFVWVGALVGGVQCWLVSAVCVVVVCWVIVCCNWSR